MSSDEDSWSDYSDYSGSSFGYSDSDLDSEVSFSFGATTNEKIDEGLLFLKNYRGYLKTLVNFVDPHNSSLYDFVYDKTNSIAKLLKKISLASYKNRVQVAERIVTIINLHPNLLAWFSKTPWRSDVEKKPKIFDRHLKSLLSNIFNDFTTFLETLTLQDQKKELRNRIVSSDSLIYRP